ncbi:P-loop containing nucleoside triphosphate hydrolase protein, partial [Geopyxis carbonaria]
DGEEGEKKPRVRASKLEYKRLDELYNKSIHDFYLAESSSSPHSKEDRWEEFIFIVRRRFDYQNKHQKTFVDIKSVELRTVLREILKNVNVVGLREEKPSMDPHLLFNYLPQIEESLAKAKSAAENPDSTLISHLTVLVDYITSDYASVAKRLYPLLEHHEITFDLLWALFLPNTLVYTVCAGSNEPRCLKLDWGEQKESMDRGKFFQMEAHYVDYDGKSFGQANALLEIDEFYGTRRIDSLGVFPLAYHGEEEHIRDKLINRGRKFGSLKGMHYKFYKGQAFLKKKREIMRLNIHGRVMIDPVTFRRINPNYRMSPVKEGSPAYTPSSILGDDDSEDDDDPDGDRCFGGREEDDYDDINIHSLKEMTDEELLLCSPTVLGFSFSDKTWAEFAVSHISEIEFNPEAFDSLVLPEKQKTIVRALVESHSGKEGRKIGIDDVIKGKGKGLVAVLHGRPGVGKTLTAEGISEYLKRPLYMVGAGDLGTDARTLETQLSRILDIAHVWGAVLLLDEADVFLERRSVHELQRNALVSIFLRLLEYFQGILFLTTNRVETFDEAFQSRIHIALRYNDLDKKAKRVIWKTFLGMVAREEAKVARTPRQLVTDAELELLSRRNLNGRQIKNVVRTSQALAASMHEDLALKHLDLVLGVTEGFEHDLKGTGQLDSEFPLPQNRQSFQLNHVCRYDELCLDMPFSKQYQKKNHSPYTQNHPLPDFLSKLCIRHFSICLFD